MDLARLTVLVLSMLCLAGLLTAIAVSCSLPTMLDSVRAFFERDPTAYTGDIDAMEHLVENHGAGVAILLFLLVTVPPALVPGIVAATVWFFGIRPRPRKLAQEREAEQRDEATLASCTLYISEFLTRSDSTERALETLRLSIPTMLAGLTPPRRARFRSFLLGMEALQERPTDGLAGLGTCEQKRRYPVAVDRKTSPGTARAVRLATALLTAMCIFTIVWGAGVTMQLAVFDSLRMERPTDPIASLPL